MSCTLVRLSSEEEWHKSCIRESLFTVGADTVGAVTVSSASNGLSLLGVSTELAGLEHARSSHDVCRLTESHFLSSSHSTDSLACNEPPANFNSSL